MAPPWKGWPPPGKFSGDTHDTVISVSALVKSIGLSLGEAEKSMVLQKRRICLTITKINILHSIALRGAIHFTALIKVFNSNASTLFEKKVVGHVTIARHVTICLLRLTAARCNRKQTTLYLIFIYAFD